MKKSIIALIIILIAAVLVTGGILIGYNLNSTSSQDTGSSIIPADITTLLPTAQQEKSSTITTTQSVTETSNIVGTWKGSKSIIFIGSLDMDAVFYQNGNGDVSAKITSSMFGNYDVSTDATWVQKDATTYQITIFDYPIDVKCDGNTISLSINPYQAGLTDMSIADMDISLTLTKV